MQLTGLLSSNRWIESSILFLCSHLPAAYIRPDQRSALTSRTLLKRTDLIPGSTQLPRSSSGTALELNGRSSKRAAFGDNGDQTQRGAPAALRHGRQHARRRTSGRGSACAKFSGEARKSAASRGQPALPTHRPQPRAPRDENRCRRLLHPWPRTPEVNAAIESLTTIRERRVRSDASAARGAALPRAAAQPCPARGSPFVSPPAASSERGEPARCPRPAQRSPSAPPSPAAPPRPAANEKEKEEETRAGPPGSPQPRPPLVAQRPPPSHAEPGAAGAPRGVQKLARRQQAATHARPARPAAPPPPLTDSLARGERRR